MQNTFHFDKILFATFTLSYIQQNSFHFAEIYLLRTISIWMLKICQSFKTFNIAEQLSFWRDFFTENLKIKFFG